MARRFHVEHLEGDTVTLHGQPAQHLARVLRAQPGQVCELSDGSTVRLAEIRRVTRGAVEFTLGDTLPVLQPLLAISLLLSIIKFDRFEWSLEKATELGAEEIVPLAAARSAKPLIMAAQKRAQRWRKILIASAQQSRRLQVPRLQPGLKPDVAFAGVSAGLKLLLSERTRVPPLRRILHLATSPSREDATLVPQPPSGCENRSTLESRGVAVAIGPEGGWTDAELAAARAHQFLECSLGQNILRAETAVAAILSILNYELGN